MFGRDDDHSQKLTAPADFDGPTKNRHCTDVLCFILLIASWVVLTGIGIYAVKEGDVRLVLYPLDYDGNICGTDFAADMTDYPNLLYVNSYLGGVCVKECPDLDGVTDDNLTDVNTLITYAGLYQNDNAEIPENFIEIGDYSNVTDAIGCDPENICFPGNGTAEESWTSPGINEGYGFAYYAATSYELLYRCYLTIDAEKRLEELTQGNVTSVNQGLVDDVYSFWNKLYADVYLARKYILGFGFGVSLGVSLIYIFLLRIPILLTTIIWTSILATIALFFAGGYYAWNQATIWDEEDPKTVDDQTINVTTIASIIMFVIGGILVLFTCCMRRAIMDAIKCTKEAGKAVNSMVLILLVPVLQSIAFLIFLVPFVYYGANLASLGEITTMDVPIGSIPGSDGNVPGTASTDFINAVQDLKQKQPEIAFRVFVFDDFTKRCGWYMLFSLFWTANFIVAMGDLIIAVSVAKWYFTRNKWTIGSWTVLKSILDVIWYHSGTAAYGSLLVAIIQFIRAVLAKIQKEVKKADSKIADCILCCCQCCFWCLECLLKFINKNAYIQTAIFSTSFCKSCRESFALIFRNAARVAAISYVSAAVLIIGKLFISSVVTVAAYYILVEDMINDLYSVGGPTAIIFLTSYWISDMFMDVLDMGISTVLHCFIADEEMFEHDQRYHEESLKDYVDKHGKGSDD